MTRKKDFAAIAKAVHDSNPLPSNIEDDVSLCSYVSRTQGVELTLREADKVREALNKLEEEEDRLGESIPTHVVIDCKDAAEADFNKIVTFPATTEGRAAAEALFKAWVEETMDPDDPFDDAQIDAFIADGKCEIGEGYIAIHST